MTNINNIKCGSSSNGIVVTDLPLEVLRAMRDSINAAIQQQETLEQARTARTDTSVREWLNRHLGMDEDDWDEDDWDDDEDEDYEDYDDDYDEDYDEDDEYDPCENCCRMTCHGCRIAE